jgi:hypothetical protein
MSMPKGFVRCGPLILLRIEGAAVFAAATLAYTYIGQAWWLFAALILVPDLSMFGYVANSRIGALCYNAAHTVTSPLILIGLGFARDSSLAESIGAIWLAHIGADRMLGFGLKYATAFADTHLGRLGLQTTAADC